MDIYSFINDIIFGVIEALIIIILFISISNRRIILKEEKLKITLFLILYSIFSYWISLYIPLGYHTVAISVFTIVFLSVITKTKLYHAAIGFAIVLMFLMVTELPIILTFSFVSGVNISHIANTPNLLLYVSIIVKATQLAVIILILRSNRTFFKFLSSSTTNNLISYYLFGICLMGIFILNFNFALSSGENILLYEFLLFIIFAFYILLGIMVYKEKEELLKIHHKYELQEAYVKNIETILNIVRQEKHDFANHINTIHAICMLNKPDAVDRIKNYVDKLSSNLHASYHYYNTGNDYVDGLLAVKSNYAFNHDIHLEVDFEVPLDCLSVDSYDLISILGNIIDNAFEAVMTTPSDDDERVVSICSYKEENSYCLSVANNGAPIPKEYLHKVFENGFSTKKDNAGDHGLGLYIVKQLIEKNSGAIKVLSSDEETEFIINFYRWADHSEKTSGSYYQANPSL